MKDKRRTPAREPKTEQVKTVPPDGFSEALEDALQSLPEPPPTDTVIADWLELHSFTIAMSQDVDRPRGKRVRIAYREIKTGRTVMAFAPSIREAVIGAIRDEQE